MKWYEIDPNHFVHKGEILKLATAAGYENENAGRRLRELEGANKVEVKHEGKHQEAWYKYNPPII